MWDVYVLGHKKLKLYLESHNYDIKTDKKVQMLLKVIIISKNYEIKVIVSKHEQWNTK